MAKNKGADQLRGYREADLRLCFRICKNLVFSRRGSNTFYPVTVWNPAPGLSCSNRDIYVTGSSLSPLNIIDELRGLTIITDATSIHAEPSTVSRGVGDIGRHIEVRVEASNDNSWTSTCAFQINVKRE